MTPPTLNTDPPNADCAKRNMALLPPFGLFIPHPPRSEPSSTSTTPTSAGSESPCDAYDASRMNRSLARQWTGAPIRAIVPLPRRKLVLNGAQSVTHLGVPASHTAVGPPCLMRSAHFRDDADTDSGPEIDEEDEDQEDEGSDEDCDAPSRSRCCSYESITAVEGLAAWSFEVRPPFSRRFFPRAD
jgi:hypothetical protein